MHPLERIEEAEALWDEYAMRDEDPIPLAIRQSTIGSLRLCPGRVGHMFDEGYDPTPSEAMVFGSVVHGLIEQYLTQAAAEPGGNGPSPWPLNLLTDSAVASAIADVEAKDGFTITDVADAATIQGLYHEALDAALQWYKTVWSPSLYQAEIGVLEQPLERPFAVLPSGRVATIQGTPDLMTMGDGHDWKTAATGWKDGAAKGYASPQAPLYIWLSEHIIGRMVDRFTFWVYDRSKRRWDPYLTEWGPEHVYAALEDAYQWAVAIDAGAFPYTPSVAVYGKTMRGWWCSARYCGAWNICPGKRLMIDQADVDEERTPEWG